MATLKQRASAAKRRRSNHNAHLKATYGITIDAYEKILASQGGVCAICHGGTSKNFFAVDHNHKNGRVRGLLCARCNSGLARFMDKIENVRAAVRYLKDDGATVERILNEIQD